MIRAVRTLPILVASLVAVAPAWSGDPATPASGGRFAAPGMVAAGDSATFGGGAVQVLLSLAIVVGAIVLLGWLARRMRVMPRGRSGALRVVDEIALGAKERAVILDVGGARLVLGVSEGRVSLLHRGEAPPALPASISTSSADAASAAPSAPQFAKLLGRALGR